MTHADKLLRTRAFSYGEALTAAVGSPRSCSRAADLPGEERRQYTCLIQVPRPQCSWLFIQWPIAGHASANVFEPMNNPM